MAEGTTNIEVISQISVIYFYIMNKCLLGTFVNKLPWNDKEELDNDLPSLYASILPVCSVNSKASEDEELQRET